MTINHNKLTKYAVYESVKTKTGQKIKWKITEINDGTLCTYSTNKNSEFQTMNNYNKVKSIYQAKQWIIDGWGIFKSQPSSWIGMVLIFVIFNGLSINIPYGKYLVALLAPCLIGGIYLALDSHSRGEIIRFTDIFSIFRDHTLLKKCLTIGVFGMAVMVLNTLIVEMPGTGYMMSSYSGTSASSTSLVKHFSLADFLTGILTVCWSLAVLFGVPLVVIKKMQAIPALKLSVIAILVNLIPMIVLYGILFVLIFIATIPFGLGLIILAPVIFCTLYCAFNSLFSKEEI